MSMRRSAISVVTAIIIIAFLFPSVGSAQLPYETRYVDRQTGRTSVVQPMYAPKKIVDGSESGTPFATPSDIFIAENGHAYVADAGNHRIVELDADGAFVRTVGEEEGPGRLNAPEGVFVAGDGTIYVANTGARSVVTYDAEGRWLRTFEKPESDLLYEDYHFLPSKLVVDQRGVLYLVVKDSYQGLFRMNAQGEFTGFFGANKTKLTWMDRLKRALLSKETLAKEAAKRPNAIESVALTEDGFLLVTSSGAVSDGQIRKLNAGGADAFGNRRFNPQLVETAADDQGFLYSVDRSASGNITIYDPNGFPIAFFGTGDEDGRQLGVVTFPTSIAVGGSADIWIADSAQNLIQVFERTDFGETFLKANELYFQGEYEKSKPYWEEVIRHNGMMNVAWSGMGKVALYERDYRAAAAYFEEAKDAKGYSDAFWYVRYEWIRAHFVATVVGAAVGLWGVAFLSRRWRTFAAARNWPPAALRYGSDIRDGFYTMFRPYDGFYRLKERRISWSVTALILVAAVAANLYSAFGSSLIAYPYDIARVNVPLTVGLLLVPWITWVVANYLVSSVKGGEGRFREVFQASAFALVPYIVMTIPITLLSNWIVMEEWVLYDLGKQAMWVWVVLLFFVMTQVVHNFDFLETAKNLGITLFTIAVIWIFAAIVIALGANLYDFLEQLYREVTFVA